MGQQLLYRNSQRMLTITFVFVTMGPVRDENTHGNNLEQFKIVYVLFDKHCFKQCLQCNVYLSHFSILLVSLFYDS